ncbi:LacI family transcriptional regulator [Verrucomicrobium sp. GAS474]|uniref:LacI family DNA-binding transcriptional regulator n=1 Tax=Verrucomicrobium sp. GAS474 TaxID=1882831 RepID=UPI00087BC4E3|nr:LacI family DNA-binding transcriptional regulator [Verrucomicrobium sp. GAS474]SDT92993.1 LacI family transcriptional regulator [Verrucomicrobium sp. GAS474]
MATRITLKDIAARAGVHVSTVSLALRNDPRLLPATREQLQALALEMGYSPDAMMSALCAYRNARRPAPLQSEIAYLVDLPLEKKYASHKPVYELARERAMRLGYNLEVFCLGQRGMTLERLKSIWRSRNIRGVLIAPWETPGKVLGTGADWSDLAVIAVGHSVSAPAFHRAISHQSHNMSHHLEALRQRGYRRIGLHLMDAVNLRTSGFYHGAYLHDQATHPDKQPPRLLTEVMPSAATLRKWIRAERLDCVISYNEQRDCLEAAGVRLPGDLGFSLLDRSPFNPIDRADSAGFDHKIELCVTHAIESLITLIHQQVNGISPNPRYFMVQGEFYPGATVRPLPEPAMKTATAAATENTPVTR